MFQSGSPENNDRKIKCEVLSDELLTENAEQEGQTYICLECTPIKNLSTEKQLNNHRRKFHKGQDSGFKCQLCNQTFLTPRKLRKHKKISHVFTKTFPCQFCDERFINEKEVKMHEQYFHKGQILSTTCANPTTSFQPSPSSSALNERTSESTARVNIKRELDDFVDFVNPNESAALKMPKTESICDFESFSFSFPTESVLKDICKKLSLVYHQNVYKFWEDIVFKRIPSFSTNIQTHRFKSPNICACLSLFFTGEVTKCYSIQDTVYTAFRDELLSSDSSQCYDDIDEMFIVSSVTEEQIKFVAKFFSCRIGIYEDGKLKKYGKWNNTAEAALTLILSFNGGVYSVVLNL